MKSQFALIFAVLAVFLSSPANSQSQQTRVLGWGDSYMFQVNGDPPAISRMTTNALAVADGLLTNAVAIATGTLQNLALLSDGTIFGWGENRDNIVLGYEVTTPGHVQGLVKVGGQTLSNVVSVAAGNNFSIALQKDGTPVIWSKNSIPAGLSNVVAIAAHGATAVVLKRDGTVVSWQNVPWGNSTHVPTGLSNVIAIATGGGWVTSQEKSMALKSDGTVVAWPGYTPLGEPVPMEATNVTAISVGSTHRLALRKDGTVIGWGDNTFGQSTGTPTTPRADLNADASGIVTINGQILTNVVAISACGDFNLALRNDGTIAEWGRWGCIGAKDLASLTNVVAVTAGDERCFVIQKQ